MLSNENPPPDPSDISPLKSVCTDEKTSANNLLQFEVDLLNSGLDDNNPIPKFSIRDYVCSTRGKDIKNNWPFSQKNLQLFLKHGVKDVLPPFQPLDSVRNPSIVECASDILRDSDVKHPELNDHSVGEKLNEDILNINSCEFEEDKELPSSTTSQSCSDINSVHLISSRCLEPEVGHLPASLIKKPESAVQISKKVESNNQSPVKKCRLIVKLNNIAELKSNEESAVNTPVVLESMASKVCPVCKTFSSSSNTTLNAHIDQCLSGESSIKWTTNSKVIKHRIKPRKTRLMADIYETALQCTLEDLDKRNGTNWATNLGHPCQDSEARAEEVKRTHFSVSTEDNDQEGDVYIDSSGTKLRILSKFSHFPSKSNADDYDVEPSKFVKRDKGSKLLSSKKKYVVQKHKLQKHSFDGHGSCSSVSNDILECHPHEPNSCYKVLEVNNSHQNLFHSEGYKGDDDPTQPLTASDQMKSDDFGMIKKWVGSKRTGLKKKTNLDLGNQHPDKNENMRVKSVSSLGSTLSKGTTVSISPVSSDENTFVPTKSHKRKENLRGSREGCVGPAFPLLKSQHSSDKRKHLMFSKFNVKLSSKDILSVHEHHVDPPNGTENHVSSRCNKKMRISSSLDMRSDGSLIDSNVSQHHTVSSEGKKCASSRKTSLGHTISSGSKKFSSLRTKLLSVRHAPVLEPKKNLGRKILHFKKPRRLCSFQLDDEEVVASQSALRKQNNLGENAAQLEKNSGKLLINRTRVLKIRKKIGGIRNAGEGDMTSEGLESSPEPDGHSIGKNADSFTGGNVPVTPDVMEEEAEMPGEFVCEPTYGISDGEAFVSFSKSLDSAFHGLADSHVVEMDADEGQGNYFVDVDPIPIPGPPGSFLPSPGRMGSEELQGHSSLTTCRIQSSEEGHEVVDADSSDSQISAMSGVSNSVAARSNSISVINLSVQSRFQQETRGDISEDRSDPLVKGSSPYEQVASGERELNLLESRFSVMVQPEVPHEVPREVQNIQPCCCSRKDGPLQGGSLNYQESQILRRRTMTSPVLTPEKQMSHDPKNETRYLNLGSNTHSENEPIPEPEKHAANLPMGYTPMLASHNSETMLPAYGDCESPSPSNPVLRLMGKNLMVVNKDDNLSPQTRPNQSSLAIDHHGLRLSAQNGLSTSNNQNELNSLHHNLSRGPSTFDNMQQCRPAQHFDFNSSDGFKVPANYGPPQLPAHPPIAMFSSVSFSGNVASRCHGYASGFNLIADQLGSKIRLDSRTTYDSEKAGHHLKTPEPSGGKHKEIIIIDDSPETEPGLAVNAAHCDPRHGNPFYSYQTRNYPHFNGSPIGPNGNGMTANLGKWNCIPEGSSVLHSNASNASLPSKVHMRSSSVYFSPGFS